MSKKAMKLATEFNRYFTGMNGVDVPERVSVPRDEWRALFAALAEQPAQGCDHCNHALYSGTKCKNCGRVTEQAAIKRDLTPEQPAQQEPFSEAEILAWAERHDIQGTPLCLRCAVEDAASLRPALPATPQPAQRKPLSKGEIYTAYITATNQTLRPQDEGLAFAFARAIEAAHGIGEKK